jgi:hypothetical protein
LSEWISQGVLASWVPRDAVDEAVQVTGKAARRKGGKLPPHVMVYFVMALALLAEEDYEEVWTRLTETLADWGCWEDGQAAVTTGGITQFFIRKHPHWRIRYQPPRPQARGRVEQHMRTLSDSGLIAGWTRAVYEPEVHAFGGPQAMVIAHRLLPEAGGRQV